MDNAALALENKAFYVRKVGTDGYQIRHSPTIKKVVNDRLASLDEAEVKKAVTALVKEQFKAGAAVPLLFSPENGDAVPDSPRLTLVVMDPVVEWDGEQQTRQRVREWTERRGGMSRLYPAALLWCFRRPGRDLQGKVELWLAWERVRREVRDGTLGGDLDRRELGDIEINPKSAKEEAIEEVWGGYRYVVLADNREDEGIRVIDLGAGHASTGQTLTGRILTTLRNEGLLSESVGAGYIERNWPPALKEAGAWPLTSLRQSFLNGALTRLLDPDAVLCGKIAELVWKGEFGLASGQKPDSGYERVWFNEPVSSEEVTFQPGLFLLLKATARALKTRPEPVPVSTAGKAPVVTAVTSAAGGPEAGVTPTPVTATQTFRISGDIPPEVWNRLGTKVLPKLRSGSGVRIGIEFTVTVDSGLAQSFQADLKQILEDLGLSGRVQIERQ